MTNQTLEKTEASGVFYIAIGRQRGTLSLRKTPATDKLVRGKDIRQDI